VPTRFQYHFTLFHPSPIPIIAANLLNSPANGERAFNFLLTPYNPPANPKVVH